MRHPLAPPSERRKTGEYGPRSFRPGTAGFQPGLRWTGRIVNGPGSACFPMIPARIQCPPPNLRIQSGSTRRGEGGGAQLAARSRSGAGDGAPAASFSPVSRRLSSPTPLRVSWILPPRAAPAASAVIFVSNPVPLLSCAGGFAAAPPTRGCPGAFPLRRQTTGHSFSLPGAISRGRRRPRQ